MKDRITHQGHKDTPGTIVSLCLRRLSEGQGEAPPGPPITLRVEMPVQEQEIPRAVQSGSSSMLVPLDPLLGKEERHA